MFWNIGVLDTFAELECEGFKPEGLSEDEMSKRDRRVELIGRFYEVYFRECWENQRGLMHKSNERQRVFCGRRQLLSVSFIL